MTDPQPAEPRISRVWASRWLPVAAVALILTAWPLYLMKSEPGPPSPGLNFALKDMNGRDVNLEDFKGRPLLINFWATWCAPCKAEVPWFVEFVEKYRDENLAIIGVSIDDTPEDIQKFAADFKVNYPMLVGRDHEDLIRAYEASVVVPVSWFIRADGEAFLKVQGIHPKEWFETQIKALVGQSEWW